MWIIWVELVLFSAGLVAIRASAAMRERRAGVIHVTARQDRRGCYRVSTLAEMTDWDGNLSNADWSYDPMARAPQLSHRGLQAFPRLCKWAVARLA